MTILAPNAAEFKAMLAAKKTFLADFYATWCGPCKMESYVLRNCLARARRRLLLLGEQVCLLMGEVWSMHSADTQSIVVRREEAKRQRHI